MGLRRCCFGRLGLEAAELIPINQLLDKPEGLALILRWKCSNAF